MAILISRKEAAAELGICTKTLDNLIINGKLKPTRIGRKVLLRVEQLKKFAAGDHPKLEPQAA